MMVHFKVAPDTLSLGAGVRCIDRVWRWWWRRAVALADREAVWRRAAAPAAGKNAPMSATATAALTGSRQLMLQKWAVPTSDEDVGRIGVAA